MSSYHPAAELFPLMEEADLLELAADIKANGLRQSVLVDGNGRIIDGRNRLLACERAGVLPRYKVHAGDDDGILAFVLSANLHRRHLTIVQKAAIAAELSSRKHGDTLKQGSEASREASGISDAKAAKLLGVSEASVERAKALKRDAPDLHAKVKAGELTAAEARREAARRTVPKQVIEQEKIEEQESKEEEGIDDTKFILEHLANGLKLVEYYKHAKPQEIARLIDPARRKGAIRKIKRLGNWLKDLSDWLEQGR